MDMSVNGPQKMGNLIIEEVWYEGTDAIKEGEAVCYNIDYGTAATSFDGRRCNRVERPSLSNSKAFAGVCECDYSAQPAGQRLRIAVPGSKGAVIALAVDAVIGTGLLSFIAGATGSHRGRFYTGKYKGRGSAIPRQTVADMIEAGTTGGTISVDATDGKTVTVADSSDMAADDTFVLLGGEDDGTGVDVPGKYNIASITDSTTIVLSTTCLSTLSTGSLTLTAVIYNGNPKCQADLLTGEEVGGVEFIVPRNTGTTGVVYMTGGVTYVCGGITIGSADDDVTFAQGTLPDEKKAFICLGTLSSNAFCVDLATAGIQVAGTALNEVNSIDLAADAAYFQFQGARWFCQDVYGGATEA